MKLQEVRYEVVEHDYDSSCTSHCGYIYAPLLPSKAELMKQIESIDWYASHVDHNKLTMILPNGKLPGSIRLVWKDTSRIAYTVKPAQ